MSGSEYANIAPDGQTARRGEPPHAEDHPPMTVEELLDLRTSDFAAYVREHVGDEDDDLWDALFDPKVAHTTKGILTALNTDIEGQLGQRKAKLEAYQNECFLLGQDGRQIYFDALAEYNVWKRRAIGFKRIVARRIEEARSAVMKASSHRYTPRGESPPPNPTKIQHNIRSLFELAYAVHQHRNACLAANIIPERHDMTLWEMLDSCSAFSARSGAQTLSEWLEHAMAQPDWVPPAER